MRLFESGLFVGIPLFGYFVGVKTIEDINYLSLLKLCIASFFCGLSVFSVGEAYRGSSNLKKSFIFLLLSSFSLFTERTLLFFLPPVIYVNWCFFYLLRMSLYFADIVLHFAGGVLQFFLGFWVATQEFKIDLYSFFISLLPALSFTGGYIIDLIQDIQEDKEIGRKNAADKVGVNFAGAFSTLLFVVAYIIALLSMESFKILVLIAIILHAVAYAIFSKRKNFLFYRNFYRLSFIFTGLIWVAQKFLRTQLLHILGL